ncbi:MAG TPA: hypothetical protein VFO46_02430 [Candidatus Sulfotelmatobacter sp.]|nr:hypothetical protein [Candidatus Sulfotelmatobacter sp.]
MITHTLTITGDGNPHPVSATRILTKWFRFQATVGNAATVRIGDSATTSSVGWPLNSGAALNVEPVTELSGFYDLSQIYAYVASGDSLLVAYFTG